MERKFAHVYGSSNWKRLRNYKICLNPLCEHEGCYKQADEVHHIVPLVDGGAAFDLDNLMSLCSSHHHEIERQTRQKKTNDKTTHARYFASNYPITDNHGATTTMLDEKG